VDLMLGFSLGLAGGQRSGRGGSWSPGNLIPSLQPGFWANGFAPPVFSPELLLTIGQPGFWANLQEAQQ
jgi:hypothetical protein